MKIIISKLIFITVVIFWVLLSSFPAYAMLRGNDIYPVCEQIREKPNPNEFNNKSVMDVSLKRGFLIGYCIGVVGTSFQAIRGVGYTWSVNGDFAKCMENYYGFSDIDGNQIFDMTMKYLKSHPEHRNLEINVIMASMLNDSYPPSVCLKNNNK